MVNVKSDPKNGLADEISDSCKTGILVCINQWNEMIIDYFRPFMSKICVMRCEMATNVMVSKGIECHCGELFQQLHWYEFYMFWAYLMKKDCLLQVKKGWIEKWFGLLPICLFSKWHLAFIHWHFITGKSTATATYFMFLLFMLQLQQLWIHCIDWLNLIDVEARWDIDHFFLIFAQSTDERNFNEC